MGQDGSKVGTTWNGFPVVHWPVLRSNIGTGCETDGINSSKLERVESWDGMKEDMIVVQKRK